MISGNYFFKEGEDSTYCYYRFIEEMGNRLHYLFGHPKLDLLEELKDNHRTTTLNNICIELVRRGEQPEYEKDGEVIVIKTVDLKDSYIDYEKCLRTSKEFLNKVPNAQVVKGDILVASTGYGSVGKVDIYDRDETAIVDGHISILRLKEEYDPYFVAYFLRSSLGQLQFEKWFSGSSGQIEIKPEDLAQFIIPQIPFKKQRDFALKTSQKIEEALKLEEEAKERNHQAVELLLYELDIELPKIKKIDYYIDYIEGKDRLDFQYNNPSYNTVYKSIEKSKYPVLELGNCVNFLKESRNPQKDPDSDFEYVDIGNIDTYFGEVNSTTIKGRNATSSRMRRVMYSGCVLVSTTRPTRNAVAIVPTQLDGEICSTGFAVLECKNNILKEFLFLVLRTPIITYQLEKLTSGSEYPEVNQKVDLPKIKIPKPDKTRQQEIIDKVNPVLEEAKLLNDNSNKRLNEARELFDELILPNTYLCH